MNDYLKERERQRKREYHREWRKNHPESVKAAQMKYWAKKAAEIRDVPPSHEDGDQESENHER